MLRRDRGSGSRRRPARLLLVSIGIAILVLGACNGQSGGTPKVGLASNQALRFPIMGDFSSLDPASLDLESDSEIAHNIFDGLVRFDANLNLVPDIATTMPTISTDGLTYTFTLRKDVSFSNGDKLTSRDVLYSWNRAAAIQGPYALNLSAIAGYDNVSQNTATGAALETLLEKGDPSVTMTGLTAPDDYTVVVKLSSAAGWFLAAIGQPSVTGMVVDQNAVKSDVENWWSKPEALIGTGAFRMTAHTPNQSIDFAPVPNWWGSPKPTLTSVHLDISADRAFAVTKYEQGAYDVVGYGAYGASVADVRRIQGNPVEKGQLVLQPKNATYWVSFNLAADASRLAKGPFTLDQGASAHDLRLALALAVDKTRLAKEVCQNILCLPATGGLIPKGMLGYLGDNADPLAAYDPIRAKQLLDGADPTRSKTSGLAYVYDSENPLSEPTAKFLQSQWLANLGLTVDLRPVPRSTFVNNRLKGGYVLARDGWAADYDDPQAWFDNLWGTLAGCPDAACTSGYDTKAYDSLLAKADAEPRNLATGDYRALSHQLIDDVVYIPLYQTVSAYLIKPYVEGAGANNFFDFYWNQVQIVSH